MGIPKEWNCFYFPENKITSRLLIVPAEFRTHFQHFHTQQGKVSTIKRQWSWRSSLVYNYCVINDNSRLNRLLMWGFVIADTENDDVKTEKAWMKI